MFPLFNALLAPFVPGLWIYTLHRRHIKGKSAASLAGQWGQISPAMRAFGRHDGPKIWLHAVSVGETVAARPIARALKARMPNVKIVLSSTTDTGHEVALGAVEAGEADLAFYFPLDLAPVVTRVLNALRPDAIGFVETELWPNLLHLARKRGIRTFQLNGRVSDNLLKSAPRLGPLWKWMSGNVSQFQMRGESDAARLRQLGVPDEKIVVVGDVKLEVPPVASADLRAKWRAKLGLGDDEKLLICGSTHPGEEDMILDEFPAEIARMLEDRDNGDYNASLKSERFPQGLRLAIAPRHIEREGEIYSMLNERGIDVACRSLGEKFGEEGLVYLLDTVGELADFYAAGDLAFVGGSLIPRGGHNILEPVLRGVPVLFGPHMMNFRAAAQLVCENDLGTQVEDASELGAAIERWLKRDEDYAARVEAALSSHRGAAARAAEWVAVAVAGG